MSNKKDLSGRSDGSCDSFKVWNFKAIRLMTMVYLGLSHMVMHVFQTWSSHNFWFVTAMCVGCPNTRLVMSYRCNYKFSCDIHKYPFVRAAQLLLGTWHGAQFVLRPIQLAIQEIHHDHGVQQRPCQRYLQRQVNVEKHFHARQSM